MICSIVRAAIRAAIYRAACIPAAIAIGGWSALCPRRRARKMSPFAAAMQQHRAMRGEEPKR